MGQLIDFGGLPVDLEKVTGFRLVKREWLFCPAYEETEQQTFSIFARMGGANKKKFRYTSMVPFGMILGDKEKPCEGTYEIKSFGEAVATNILSDLTKALGDAAALAADALRIDTSGIKSYRIMRTGRSITNIKVRDIPAKVKFLSGKISDVFKNDSIYEFLGEPIAPIIVPVPTLVMTMGNTTHVIFGNGIDMPDTEAVYHSLLDMYNAYQAEKEQKKPKGFLSDITINLPKINFPTINIQWPFGSAQQDAKEPEKLEASVSENTSIVNGAGSEIK